MYNVQGGNEHVVELVQGVQQRTVMMCLDKPKYGGPGKKKQCCIKWKCLNLISEPLATVSESASTHKPDVEDFIKTLHSEALKLGTQHTCTCTCTRQMTYIL